jgi:hypothetical protein
MGKLCQILSKWTGMKATKIDVCIYYKLCIHLSWLHVYLMSCCGWPKRRKSCCHSYIATYTPLSKLWHQWVSNWQTFIFRTRSERFPSLSHEFHAPISSCNKNCCEVFWLHFRLHIRHESSAYECYSRIIYKKPFIQWKFPLFFSWAAKQSTGGYCRALPFHVLKRLTVLATKKKPKIGNYTYTAKWFLDAQGWTNLSLVSSYYLFP